MGYFDMASVYSPEYKLSINELTLELWGESGHTRDESYTNNDFDALRHRLNSKDSGLVQRLQKINIDLEPILTGTNEREKFDALRILKLFYKTIYIEYPKVKIIKLLEKPRFGNFTVGYTRDRANYDCFMCIYNSIRSEIECAEEYERETTRLDAEWSSLADTITRLFYFPEIIRAGQPILPIMNAMLPRLKELNKERKSYGYDPSVSDGILSYVFLRLIQHKYLAQITEELIRSDNVFVFRSENDAHYSEIYFSKLVELGDPELITWHQIELINSFFSQDGNNPFFSSDDIHNAFFQGESEKINERTKAAFYIGYIFSLILGTESFTGILEERSRKYAEPFQYVRIIADWLVQRYHVNFEAGIPLLVLIGIVQTVYFIKVKHVKYKNDYYGNRTKGRSLMAAIQDGENADAAAKLEVEIRVRKRILYALSGEETVSTYGQLQSILLEFKEQVFTQNTLANMKKIHQYLYTKAELIIKTALDEVKSLIGLSDFDVWPTATLGPLVSE